MSKQNKQENSGERPDLFLIDSTGNAEKWCAWQEMLDDFVCSFNRDEWTRLVENSIQMPTVLTNIVFGHAVPLRRASLKKTTIAKAKSLSYDSSLSNVIKRSQLDLLAINWLLFILLLILTIQILVTSEKVMACHDK